MSSRFRVEDFMELTPQLCLADKTALFHPSMPFVAHSNMSKGTYQVT